MTQNIYPVYIGNNPRIQPEREVKGGFVNFLGDQYYMIENFDAMDPFFMSITSSCDHWLFISSTGGLSAGRINAQNSLFPYYTVDKLSENFENTGHKAILRVKHESITYLWEPFSIRNVGTYQIQRNIFKNIPGSAVIFEEQNLTLGITFRYAWRTSEKYGFIKTGWLENTQTSDCDVEFLDGFQNILPANVPLESQNLVSNLLDAYKRAELIQDTSLAVYSLSSRLSDLAEPSESLRATIVYQVGINSNNYLLSSQQLDNFRDGLPIHLETEIRGQRGAYFVHSEMNLKPNETKSWHIVSDLRQDSVKIIQVLDKLAKEKSNLMQQIENDLSANTSLLNQYISSVDGLQLSGNSMSTSHHYANTLFNAMRGGIFVNNYRVEIEDFKRFISFRNPMYLDKHQDFLEKLPANISIGELQSLAWKDANPELILFCQSYLPLSFSRRHGDPSRPWNRFEIETSNPDGSLKIGYEGNWRDIFQNWEALAYSYPEYVENMISVFLNSTTVDGYNPYRINQDGIDWEIPQPGNPWANIGYWSDHQIIYLQKLLEISSKVHPGGLHKFIQNRIFSFANIPYRIKKYQDLLNDPYESILFDWDLETEIDEQVRRFGSDGKFIHHPDGSLYQVNLIEKILSLLLAKMVNFVPDGGIWMNTQRPEWNDANNALVGKGLSVVTAGYLLRTINFFSNLLSEFPFPTIEISKEISAFFKAILQSLSEYQDCLQGSFDDKLRRDFMDSVGQAGSDFRWNFYSNGLSSEFNELAISEMQAFLDLSSRYLQQTLRNNKRVDHLFHSYNILNIHPQGASISPLYEMLEGQVSVLSSHLLSMEETISLLDNLRNSKLYRSDQNSYLLYPDKVLPGFLQKNQLSPESIAQLKLIPELMKENDSSLFIQDIHGNYHFNGDLKNIKDVQQALSMLGENNKFTNLVLAESEAITVLFEKVFRHREFTGRSGTFFAYEGLGSIYWHMVSKLLLAVQESIFRFRKSPRLGILINHYREIRNGLGFNKPPEVYGAFPTDPYSHTPKGKGASQPGMTGSVKEEILIRISELGYSVDKGCIRFDSLLLEDDEFVDQAISFSFWNINEKNEEIRLEKGSLVYTICQTPFVVQLSDKNFIEVIRSDGAVRIFDGHDLDLENSSHIFKRDGAVKQVFVHMVKV
jgi:hypothetical protein